MEPLRAEAAAKSGIRTHARRARGRFILFYSHIDKRGNSCGETGIDESKVTVRSPRLVCNAVLGCPVSGKATTAPSPKRLQSSKWESRLISAASILTIA